MHHYVSDCYSINSYLNTYGGRIKPLAGPSEWPKSNKQPLLPPLYTRKAGRPKKLRKMSAPEMTKDGTHMNRSVIVKHCKKCNKTGHNARTCPLNPTNSQRKLNPKKKGESSQKPQLTKEMVPQLLCLPRLLQSRDSLIQELGNRSRHVVLSLLPDRASLFLGKGKSTKQLSMNK